MIVFKPSLALAAIVSIVSISSACAQGVPRGRGGDGWGPQSPYGRLYDTNTVETITGRVVKVEQVTSPMRGLGAGIHLIVDTREGPVSVHLGPSWFIQSQDTQFNTDDQVQVTGSRVTFDNKPAVIAAEVRKDGQILKLRDPNGVPVWSGRRSSTPNGSNSETWRGRGRMRGLEDAQRPMICPCCGSMMHHPGAMQPHRPLRGEAPRELMLEMKARDAELKQKVEAMNNAHGEQKMEAMSAVINTLVEEREQMHERLSRSQPLPDHRPNSPADRGGNESSNPSPSRDPEKN